MKDLKMNFTLLLLVCSMLLLTTNCKKEKKNVLSSGGSSVINVNYQKASFSGIVVDESNNPISGASVNIEDYSATTNEYGIFVFENVNIPEKNAFLKVTKSGYLRGSRTFNPKFQKNATLEIELLTSSVVGSFNAVTGGTISLSNGTEVTFEPNSIKYELGNNYYGNVNVSFVHLDPTDERLLQKMPGDLIGERENGDEARLISYGMISVELTDDSGKKLQIAGGKTASIKLFIPSSIEANAPNTIPLWHFDENFGIWKEEGQAAKEGSFYVGEVSHFSWWNCDDPYPKATIKGKLLCDGVPMSGVYIYGSSTTPTVIGFGTVITNSDGTFEGYAPSTIDFTLTVYDGTQQTVIYNGILNLGEVLDIGTIDYCPSRIKGNLKDCSGNLVSGYIYLRGTNSNISSYTTTGEFDLYCQSSTTYSVFAATADYSSTPINATSGALGSTTDIGDISVCAEQLYCNFYLDGGVYSNQYVELDLDNNLTYGHDYGSYISIWINDVNSIDFLYGSTYTGELNIQLDTYFPMPDTTTNENVTFNITEMPANIGGIIKGTFSGSFTNTSGIPHTISNGKFAILRK
ncbi:MAG: carboxypeptidase-like regulatory domain-containing protein [Bacteroidia bacterium]